MSFANNMQVALVFKMVDELTRPLNGLKGTLGGVQEKFEKLKHSASGVFDGMQRAGIASAGMGAGILAGVKHGVEAFSDLEQSAVRLQNVLGGADGMDPYFKTISDQAIKMGMTLPGSTREFYDLAAAMRRGGADSKDIANGLFEATARLKLVQDLAPEVAGEGMATTAMAFKLTGQEAIKYADIINRTANASRLKVPGFLEAMKYIGAPAKMLGLQGIDAATQVSTVMGALANTGIDPSQVGTAFEGGVSHFAKIKTRLQNARGAMWREGGKILLGKGIKLEFFDEKGNYSIPRMIAQFEKLKNLTQEQRLEIGTTIFGAEGARLALIGVNEYNEMARKQLGKEHLDTQIDRMTGTLLGKTKNVLGSFADVMATLFKPIGEALKPVLDKVNALLGHLFEWLKEHPRLTAVLAGSVTVLGLFATGLGVALVSGALLGKTVMGLIEGVKDLRAAWVILNPLLFGTKAIVASDGVGLITLKKATQGLIPAIWASVSALAAQAAAFAMSPIGLITIGVIALGVGAYFLWKNWEQVTAYMKDTGPWVEVLTAILPMVGLPLLIIKHWDKISAFFKGFWEGLKLGFRDSGDVFTDWGREVEMIKDLVVGSFGAMKDIVESIAKPIAEVIKLFDASTDAANAASGAINGTSAAFENGSSTGYVFAQILGVISKFALIISLALRGVLGLVDNLATQITDAVTRPFKIMAAMMDAWELKRAQGGSAWEAVKAMNKAGGAISEEIQEKTFDRLQKPWEKILRDGEKSDPTVKAARVSEFIKSMNMESSHVPKFVPRMVPSHWPKAVGASAIAVALHGSVSQTTLPAVQQFPVIETQAVVPPMAQPSTGTAIHNHSHGPTTISFTINAPSGSAPDIRKQVEALLPEMRRQLEIINDRAARARN